MTSTTPGRDQSSRLPVRTRDRRPALAALAILLILVGALGSALIAYRTGDRVDVLVAARDIEPGTQVTREDFTIARVAHEGGAVVEAAAMDNFVGAFATSHIPEGTLVINRMFTVTDVVPSGAQLVGVAAQLSLRPSEVIRQGDVVALYSVPPDSTVGDAEALVPAARVMHVAATSATSDLIHLTVLIADDQVAQVVQLNSYGQLAVTRLPDDTQPAVDQPRE